MSLTSTRDEELIFLSQCIFIAIKFVVKRREPSSKFNYFKFNFSKFFLSLSTYLPDIETRNGKKHRELKSMCQT